MITPPEPRVVPAFTFPETTSVDRGRWPRRAAASPYAVPLLVALMLCAVGVQIALVSQIPSWSNDEPAHLGYVAALAHGHLPTINSLIVSDPDWFPPDSAQLQGWDESHRQIWTANHPPLYHLFLVPVWWLTSGDISHAVIGMRLVNTAGFGAWLLTVWLVARALVPGRPAVSALAVVVAATPSLTMRSAYLLNDGWASAAALLAMLMVIRMIRGEITPRRVAVAALAGSIAAGTRAPGVIVVAVCAIAVLIIGIRRSGLRGVVPAAVVGGVPALATGWFYLRNLRLYGDLTGQGALLDKFDRARVESLGDVLHVPGLAEVAWTTPIPLLALLVLVPGVLVPALRRGWRPDGAWLLLGVHAVLTLVNLVTFVAAGGGVHDRYLMTLMPLLATTAALGMLHLGRRTRGDWAIASVWSHVLLVWLAGALAFLEWRHIYRFQDQFPVSGVVPLVPASVAIIAALLLLGVLRGRRTLERELLGTFSPSSS